MRVRLEAMLRANRTEKLTLDLGCGGGRYAELFPRRISVDLVRRTGVNVTADAHHLPFKSNSFDVVLATELLEHTQDPSGVVDEIRRVLCTNGILIMTTRFIFPIHDAPGDYYRFTEHGLSHLFRGWEKVAIRPDTAPFETVGVLLQRIADQSDLVAARLSGPLIRLAARVIPVFDRLINKEFGDIQRKVVSPRVLTSGYHIIATPGVDAPVSDGSRT